MHASFSIRATALALLVAAGPPAPAQAPSRLSALPELQNSAVALQSCAEGLVGFGPDYSVRFDGAGMTFTPALGRRVAQQQDLVLALQSVSHGATELRFDGNARPQADGTMATYRRSPDFGERYELRGDGVEQSFVFTELRGGGDLVVRCRLGGALARHGGASDGAAGVQFLVPGGGVQIGGVTGIDARGARCRGGLRLIDGCLEPSRRRGAALRGAGAGSRRRLTAPIGAAAVSCPAAGSGPASVRDRCRGRRPAARDSAVCCRGSTSGRRW